MTDSNFSTSYKVHRTIGKWVNGRFVLGDEKILTYYGPVQPADSDDLEQLPEGDRQKGIMKFFCAPPNDIFITMDNNNTEDEEHFTSDVIEYDKKLYKIIKVTPWRHNGFIRAFGYKIGAVQAG